MWLRLSDWQNATGTGCSWRTSTRPTTERSMLRKWHHTPGYINRGKQHSEHQEGHGWGVYFCLPEIWIRAPLLFLLVSVPWWVRWAISREWEPESAVTSAVLKLWLSLNTETQRPDSSHANKSFQPLCFFICGAENLLNSTKSKCYAFFPICEQLPNKAHTKCFN